MPVIQGLGDALLRGATFGIGNVSVYQMRAWQVIPGVRIAALANRTRARAETMGQEFGIPPAHVYGDYRELLSHETLDFVDIATAPHVHREQVLAAAAHKVHVLCQKPLATSEAEALEMIEACETAGVRCVVNENWRWRRWFQELKRMLDQGIIGKPRYARFYFHNDNVLPGTEGGLPSALRQQPYKVRMPRLLFYDMGIHLADVMRFLFGDVVRVYARLSRASPLVQGDDMAVVVLEFRSGLTGLIDISWGSHIPAEKRLVRGNVDSFLVEGEAGTIELDPYQGDLLIVTTVNGTERRPARPGMTPAEAYQESFVHTQSHFIQCLRTGRSAENEARDNLKVLAITEAAYESAARNEVISLDDSK